MAHYHYHDDFDDQGTVPCPDCAERGGAHLSGCPNEWEADQSPVSGSRPAISSAREAALATGHRAPARSRLALVEPDAPPHPFDANGEAALDRVVIALLACHVTELLHTVARQESRLRALETQLA